MFIANKNNILFHTDAVQAAGNIHIDVREDEIDLLSMSGHKIYGPKGIGALYVKKGIEFEKFINGGHQERNKRAGTENLAGIVGIGKASEAIPDIKINGTMENRLPGNSNISFKGVDGMALLLELDKKGICVSTGSACTSGNSEPSHVLTAIGLSPELANSALRVTFGEFNRKWEVDYLVDNIKEIVEKLKKM